MNDLVADTSKASKASQESEKLALWQGRDPTGHGADVGGALSLRKSPAQRAALRQIKRWTKERFALRDDETILVAELACALPGCPPLETVIAFWTNDGANRHHIKIFKPALDVTEDDLPPKWMKAALIIHDSFGCDCC